MGRGAAGVPTHRSQSPPRKRAGEEEGIDMTHRIYVGFQRIDPTGVVLIKWKVAPENAPKKEAGGVWYDWVDEYPLLVPPVEIEEARLTAIMKELI
jgi:hypothetical protein